MNTIYNGPKNNTRNTNNRNVNNTRNATNNSVVNNNRAAINNLVANYKGNNKQNERINNAVEEMVISNEENSTKNYKNSTRPLYNLANKLKETTEVEEKQNKLYKTIDKMQENKKLNIKESRDVVRKLYNYIITVNNAFSIPREDRIAYINDIVFKLNNDKEFLRNLNKILDSDDKNILDKPLNATATAPNKKNVIEYGPIDESEKEEQMGISERIKQFQKVSMANASNRLKTFFSKNSMNINNTREKVSNIINSRANNMKTNNMRSNNVNRVPTMNANRTPNVAANNTSVLGSFFQ